MFGSEVTLTTVEITRPIIPTSSRETRVNDVLISSEQAGACASSVKNANLQRTDLRKLIKSTDCLKIPRLALGAHRMYTEYQLIMVLEILLYRFRLGISCLCSQMFEELAEGTPTNPESTAYVSQPPSLINQLRAFQTLDHEHFDMQETIPNKDSSQQNESLKRMAERNQIVRSSSLDDEVISLPDPSTRLFTHDEIIHVYESRPVQGGGEEYRICVRDKHKDEVELWTQEAVKSRPDFQRLHT
ncbi:hypothetical protein P170DRAFT_427307 [Aspergillus steynii IBT 23096]|uniref:Uncharacterized protein n=1 Tax=Aspergillus steynii IBT 23096 TaxID=1392250 RepID=A0A2I2G5P0_9EURO|nr:uncharacterized protein P170DRAFT_427307 [Aspergillus steynii IBT 23096]PLB48198.1 hypothetical protein P170DRAFT_427307 [Aspergillus steynii IBT 23096]